MPAAIAIPAIASVVGAGAAAYGQHKAGKAAERANREALAYERERETAKRAKYDKALDVYRKNYQTWLSMYGDKGIKRYGMPSGIEVRRPGEKPAAAPAGTPSGPAGQAPGFMRGAIDRTKPLTAAGGVPMRPMPADPNAGRGWGTLGQIIAQGGQVAGQAYAAHPGKVGGFGGTEFDPTRLKFDPRLPERR